MAKKKTVPVRKVEKKPEAVEKPVAPDAPEATEAPEEEVVAAEPPVERFHTRATSISHGDRVYKAENGTVELPAGEVWYRDLIRSGALTPVKEK